MFSKREREGYVLIDHRYSPGLENEDAAAAGLLGLPVGRNKVFEAATDTCWHCKKVVIRNPHRTRERANCSKCDHYICDPCALEMQISGVCKPWSQVLEEAARAASKIII
jgi:hypothetical protein